MTRCEEWKSYPPKKKKGIWGYGMATSTGSVVIRVLTWSKGCPKRGNLMYILYVWVAQLMRPIKKEKS